MDFAANKVAPELENATISPFFDDSHRVDNNNEVLK